MEEKTLKEIIKNLQDDIYEINNSIDDLDSKHYELENRIDDQDDRLTFIDDLKIIFEKLTKN